MANHMAEVAKMLGVELGEEFRIDGSKCDFYFTDTDLMVVQENEPANASILSLLIKGLTIKRKPWKPKDGEMYYTVEADGNIIGSNFYSRKTYASTHINYYKLGNCYRTEEEAEANSDKWIAFYASDEVLEV